MLNSLKIFDSGVWSARKGAQLGHGKDEGIVSETENFVKKVQQVTEGHKT